MDGQDLGQVIDQWKPPQWLRWKKPVALQSIQKDHHSIKKEA